MIIAQGKTKTVTPGPRPNTVLLNTADVLTGGDAAKREMIKDIGIYKTTQAANVFGLLNRKGLPTAFIERSSPNALLCYQCEMLPLELVIRRYAWGTYLLRHPEYKKPETAPHRFDRLVWEFFHKNSVVTPPLTDSTYQMGENEARDRFLRQGVWEKGVYTDPYLDVSREPWVVYPPKEPLADAKPLLSIEPLLDPGELEYLVNGIMLPTFEALESSWAQVITSHGPVALVDLKIEVGRRQPDNKLVVADVIDNDSWRIWPGGDPKQQLDKQCFRDDHPLSRVAENYVLVAELTEQFSKKTWLSPSL
ncbi:MAG: phosphoribosylaminoimidazolesuccinocarboxamide synthase [Firmicutes bacterium]|nr:phosphoribosylaminoimidazolesuccinocarboxamide synthase [Bacillota bacterium]